MKILQNKVGRLEQKGSFPLSERAHLSMRGGALCDDTDATSLKNEAKLVPNFVTNSTMETEPFPAVHEVTTVGSKRYTVKTWLEGAR